MILLDYHYMINSIPAILKGVPVSLSIAAVAIFFGLIIGLICALVRLHHLPILSQLATLYVSFLRGTPLIVQIFLCYYGLPILLRYFNYQYHTNFSISHIPAIVFIYIALSLNVSAFLSETIRAAILSVPQGQTEAAYLLGMTPWQTLRHVVLPQALHYALPNFTNIFISILKDTSLAFIAAVPEIIGQAKIIAGRTSQFLEVYIVAAMVYWLLCIIFELLLKRLETRLTRHYTRKKEDVKHNPTQ